MDRIKLVSELHASRLVAVVRSTSPEDALALANAAADGGIKFIEITFSVPGALDVIKELTRRGGIHVGAGTVLALQQAERAMGVGAEFIVSPSLELNLVGLCHTANIACFPRCGDADGDHRGAAGPRRLGENFPGGFGRRALLHSPDAGAIS